MWEARDADSRIVLFGSVHGLPADVNWRSSAFDTALADADLVYFETDIGPLGVVALTIKLMVQQFQTINDPWLQRLSDEQRERLQKALTPLGVTLDQAATMPPWLISLQLTYSAMQSSDLAIDIDPAFGVESVLQWELPKERKGYFETPGQQFDLLAGGPIDQQIEQLFMTIDEGRDAGLAQLQEIVRAWEAGEVKQLEMLARNPAEAAMIELLLTQRNRNWIPTIETMLADNRENLIIVGAAHLAGEGSVLDLLADAGYTVTRIQ